MGETTKIEWTDATWNPITGCSVKSPGCKNCYAMRLAGTRLRNHPSRAGLTVDTKAGPVFTGEVRFNEQWLDQPLRWKRPRMIFVCAHGDLFHENVPDDWIDKVFAIMALAPQHTFQVLTKRPERMRDYLTGRSLEQLAASVPAPSNWLFSQHEATTRLTAQPPAAAKLYGCRRPVWPLPNVWLGVSVEDQKRADERIPILLDTPASVRWISAEPLLGSVNLRHFDLPGGYEECFPLGAPVGRGAGPALDWVVAGGESGPGARPMHPDWARQIRNDCAAAGVPFHFKQWGAWYPMGQSQGLTQPNPDRRKWLHSNGSLRPSTDAGAIDTEESELDTPLPYSLVVNVGKTKAGRHLDGLLHDGFPEVAT